jgi:hypothetical protein
VAICIPPSLPCTRMERARWCPTSCPSTSTGSTWTTRSLSAAHFAPHEIALLATQVLAALRTRARQGTSTCGHQRRELRFGARHRCAATTRQGSAAQLRRAGPRTGEPISVAMDLFGLGVTLYETITGNAAFDPTLAAADRSAPPALPDCTLADLVIRLLDPDPGARPDVDSAACIWRPRRGGWRFGVAQVGADHRSSSRPPVKPEPHRSYGVSLEGRRGTSLRPRGVSS